MTRFNVTALCCALAIPACATPPLGFSSQTFRGRITHNLGVHQWNPNPLFTILMQSSSDQWGYDVVQGTTEFAVADSTGRPSQSGWHDHPTALSIGLVVQGTVWSHAAGSNCLRAFPTGSVFFERSGEIHNNYNLDPRTPAIVRIIHFVDRSQGTTRRDRPDPVTGSTTTAAPPPAPCLDDQDRGGMHGSPALPATCGAPCANGPVQPDLPGRRVEQSATRTQFAATLKRRPR